MLRYTIVSLRNGTYWEVDANTPYEAKQSLDQNGELTPGERVIVVPRVYVRWYEGEEEE